MDEKGYVLSGVGMLLLIPLMIMIPIALSLQEEGSQLPTTFTKSDVVYRTFNSIQNDIQEKIINFTDSIYNETYTYNNASKFAADIIKLDDSIKEDIYKDAYSDVVDSVKLTPNNYPKTLNMNNESGYIPLKNGIQITYNYINKTVDNGSHIIYYKYAIRVTANLTIDVVKSTARHNQTYEYSFDSQIIINTTTTDNITAENNVKSFFDNIRSRLSSYLGGG